MNPQNATVVQNRFGINANNISTSINQRNSDVLLGVASVVVEDAADVEADVAVVALGVVDVVAVGRSPAIPRMLSISIVNTFVSS